MSGTEVFCADTVVSRRTDNGNTLADSVLHAGIDIIAVSASKTEVNDQSAVIGGIPYSGSDNGGIAVSVGTEHTHGHDHDVKVGSAVHNGPCNMCAVVMFIGRILVAVYKIIAGGKAAVEERV